MTLAQSILKYGIIIWGSTYKNALEPFMITHRVLMRIMMRYYFLDDTKTETLFNKLKIRVILIDELYDELSIIEIYINKEDYDIFIIYNTRNENNINFKSITLKTTLIQMFYIEE